jgi:DNA-binding NtrC family response regulator
MAIVRGTSASSQLVAPNLVGKSAATTAVRRLIDKVSRNRLPVLLLGESGTGKEVVARAIYNANPHGEFVPIDCGSLVGTLMESELFGHVKGAFSGAVENKKGLVELADGGTAFFDEIGDLPIEMQAKLLRLIQEGEFRAVGALHWRRVDLRIMAATHRDLRAEVAAGRFRQDLFYRLNVMVLHLPPLRERKDDIPLLVEHFLRAGQGTSLPRFQPNPEVMAALLSYDWPGNVRELQHCIDRMSALHSEEPLQMEDLPSALRWEYNRLSGLESSGLSGQGLSEWFGTPAQLLEPFSRIDGGLATSDVVSTSGRLSIPVYERSAIEHALAVSRGDRSKAAVLLGIGRATLYRKMKLYAIE